MAFISNGTTILDNGAFSVGLGSLVLISEQTASGSASIEFTTGIDSTYPIYRFEFINIHPQTDIKFLGFQGSTDGGSTYATTITSTYFYAIHSEADSTYFAYESGYDLAQGTSLYNGGQPLSDNIGSDSDQSVCGNLTLFNPSSTTFVKHFMANTSAYTHDNTETNSYIAGYFNTTSAINGIKFYFRDSVNFDGTIKLYGIKDS